MESSSDKEWTSKHLLSSPRVPHPSESSSQSPPPPPYTASSSSSTAPRDSKTRGSIAGSVTSHQHRKTPSISVYPTPPASASPTRSSFHPSNPYSATASSHRQSVQSSSSRGLTPSIRSPTEPVSQGHRRRGSSLGERFPGDMSHRPLDLIRKETKAAHRSPHLRKKAIPGADVIDVLDSTFGGAYHHEGPYDATLISRNRTFKNSPVAAVKDSNDMALRATPAANIRDALDKHVPLSGVASIPPGMAGLDGKVMHYEEGADLMREPEAGGGAYKRWDHIKYLPEDLKGKGEPSYSLEKNLKKEKHIARHRGHSVGEGSSYEMQPQSARLRPGMAHQRSVSGNNVNDFRRGDQYLSADYYGSGNGEGSSGGSGGLGEGLKKRFGSFRRGKKGLEVRTAEI